MHDVEEVSARQEGEGEEEDLSGWDTEAGEGVGWGKESIGGCEEQEEDCVVSRVGRC